VRGDWKLMQNDPFSPLELYNLKLAPGEKTDLATKIKQVRKEPGDSLRPAIRSPAIETECCANRLAPCRGAVRACERMWVGSFRRRLIGWAWFRLPQAPDIQCFS